jgi:hypothetical protein
MPQVAHDQNRPVIVFGVGQIADVARVYLEQAGISVEGFTVDAEFNAETVHAGLPVHVWDALEHSAPPSSVNSRANLAGDLTCRSFKVPRSTLIDMLKRTGWTGAASADKPAILG